MASQGPSWSPEYLILSPCGLRLICLLSTSRAKTKKSYRQGTQLYGFLEQGAHTSEMESHQSSLLSLA